AVATLCAPVYVRDKRLWATGVLKYLRPYARRGRAKPPHIERELYVYEKIPLSSVDSLRRLMLRVRRRLPDVRVPVFIAQSGQDETVDPRSADASTPRSARRTRSGPSTRTRRTSSPSTWKRTSSLPTWRRSSRGGCRRMSAMTKTAAGVEERGETDHRRRRAAVHARRRLQAADGARTGGGLRHHHG
ncbi:alpha/beta hydrolase, partial [Calditerricola satsumensis]|uniref:alpha/beta hydrolase n=1 Tax=Calditerricola satsumensis TaxID=373054 RepID=UPI00357176DC